MHLHYTLYELFRFISFQNIFIKQQRIYVHTRLLQSVVETGTRESLQSQRVVHSTCGIVNGSWYHLQHTQGHHL